MSKKSCIYFSAPLMAAIENLPEGKTVSGRLADIAERYLEICKRHAVALTDDERYVLSNCISGSLIDPLLIRHLADEVEDSEFYDSEAGKTLVKKLRECSFADLVAVIESLEMQ